MVVDFDQNLTIIRRLAVVIIGQYEAQSSFSDQFRRGNDSFQCPQVFGDCCNIAMSPADMVGGVSPVINVKLFPGGIREKRFRHKAVAEKRSDQGKKQQEDCRFPITERQVQ